MNKPLIAAIGFRGFPGVQGGVEMHCGNLYPAMKGSVKIRAYRRKQYLTDASGKVYSDIEFIDLPSSQISGVEAVFHTFICCLHIIFNRPDIVHVHNIGPGMFIPLLKLMGLKTVMTYHSANYEHEKWGHIARKMLKFSEFLSLRFADCIIFVNKFQMQKYSVKIQAKSCYIPNGVNLIKRSENTDYIDKIGAESGNYLLAVGRLTAEKGFEYLVEAVNRIPEVKCLVIAGASDHKTDYYDKLKALDTNKKVIFTGFTTGEDLRQLYSHAQLFVLSSVTEGFPLVMLEAMGYGLPMIVTELPATHLVELPVEDYVAKGDVASIVAGIKAKTKNPCSKVEYDLSPYNWDKIAEQTVEVYKKCLKTDKH
jgi:glycosyltransferase involved in cell wall biosynthesis